MFSINNKNINVWIDAGIPLQYTQLFEKKFSNLQKLTYLCNPTSKRVYVVDCVCVFCGNKDAFAIGNLFYYHRMYLGLCGYFNYAVCESSKKAVEDYRRQYVLTRHILDGLKVDDVGRYIKTLFMALESNAPCKPIAHSGIYR